MTKPTKSVVTDGHIDLSCLYKSLQDPQIDQDIARLQKMGRVYKRRCKGRVATHFEAALKYYIKMIELRRKLHLYLNMIHDTDLSNEAATIRLNEFKMAKKKAFKQVKFRSEIYHLDAKILRRWRQKSRLVRRHWPWVQDIGRRRKHDLPRQVEKALNKFDVTAWSDMYNQLSTELRFKWRGQLVSLEVLYTVLQDSASANVRRLAQRTLDLGISESFTRHAALMFSMVAEAQRGERKLRRYQHVLAEVNKENRVSGKVIQNLYSAVRVRSLPLIRRFYGLKQRVLGLATLRYSDRLARVATIPSQTYSFAEAGTLVGDAYRHFSPVLGGLVDTILANNWIDFASSPHKVPGAFGGADVVEGGKTIGTVLLDFNGDFESVWTLAHELGHASEGMLAGQAQGALMARKPNLFIEVPSTFGETILFDHVVKQLTAQGKKQKLFELFMGCIGDILDSVIRQIMFSEFEIAMHESKQRLTASQLDKIWAEIMVKFYGPDGEVFVYETANHGWATVHHFAGYPLYVQNYAFSKLVVLALKAQQKRLGARFEKRYLRFLREGQDCTLQTLAKCFDINPRDPKFWHQGLMVISRMITRAERLARELNLIK